MRRCLNLIAGIGNVPRRGKLMRCNSFGTLLSPNQVSVGSVGVPTAGEPEAIMSTSCRFQTGTVPQELGKNDVIQMAIVGTTDLRGRMSHQSCDRPGVIVGHQVTAIK